MAEHPFLLLPIFAQVSIGGSGADGPPLWLMPLALVAMIILVTLIVVVPVVSGLRHAARERQLEHIERLKALEMGRPMPGDAPWWSPGRVAVTIGAGVPIGVFGVVWLAILTTGTDGSFAWPAAGGVSLAAVICGTILAVHLPQQSIAQNQSRIEKPAFDPDAYDIAGHHG